MGDEVLDFANGIGAKDLKAIFSDTEYSSLFKRRNYFLLEPGRFLVIKISRNKIKPFYGFGKAFYELFNKLTENGGEYYFVALESNKSGWVLTKTQIQKMIANKSLSISSDQREYKVNNYNLKDHDYFASTEAFLRKVSGPQK